MSTKPQLEIVAPEEGSSSGVDLVREDLLVPAARGTLLALLRKAQLRHDDVAKEILVNFMLRNYIHHSMYREADLFVTNVRDTLSSPHRSNNQAARYFYYVGLIKVVQLNYTDASDFIQQALRKAPDKAVGFKTIVTKYWVLVQLLLGEIPPRSTFRQPEWRLSLYPYLQLASAVRFGRVHLFTEVLEKYNKTFRKDGTLNLVKRVRENVIKAGLRRIIQAYSRLPISDICQKLDLYPEDAEYIIAKAIGDGVIDATIDNEAGVVISTEIADIYATPEPAAALHKRIDFLTAVHNRALMSMRYMPPDDDSDHEAEIEKRKEEEKALEMALEEEAEDMGDMM